MQEHFSYFEATCLLAGYEEVLEMKELYERDKDNFHSSYPCFRDCYNLLKTAKDTRVLPQEVIPRSTLARYFKSRNIHVPGFTNLGNIIDNIHPSIDSTHPRHAPEMLLATKAWEAKYLNGEYPNHEHTPAIEKILKNWNITGINLIKRICAITNPDK